MTRKPGERKKCTEEEDKRKSRLKSRRVGKAQKLQYITFLKQESRRKIKIKIKMKRKSGERKKYREEEAKKRHRETRKD